jgi:hypothetical protein
MSKNQFKLNFLGVGAQKAATSWIFKCLTEHPDISMPSVKETHFFSNDKDFSNGLKFYKSYFKECDFSKIVGEYSTSYLSNKNTPVRIKDNFPDVKIIFSLRNPADRAFSHFLHIKYKNRLNKNTTLKDAIKEYPEIIENGMYARHLKTFFDVFPGSNMLILFYDDINKDPKSQIEKLYTFLGVDKYFVPDGINAKYNTSSARRSSLHSKVNKFYFFLKKSFTGRFIIKVLKFLKINSYLFYGLLNKYNKKPILSDEDRKYL